MTPIRQPTGEIDGKSYYQTNQETPICNKIALVARGNR